MKTKEKPKAFWALVKGCTEIGDQRGPFDTYHGALLNAAGCIFETQEVNMHPEYDHIMIIEISENNTQPDIGLYHYEDIKDFLQDVTGFGVSMHD
jgi:hypothetical protein